MVIGFDRYEIEPAALELRKDGRRIDLAPMAVRVLMELVRRHGALVTRDEIYRALWPAGGVDRERLLNTYVRQIRAALGERAGDDRFIRTYPRRGYRFLPEVREGGVPAEAGVGSHTGDTPRPRGSVSAEPGRGAREAPQARDGAASTSSWRRAATAATIGLAAASLWLLMPAEGAREGRPRPERGAAATGDPSPSAVALRMGEELLERPLPLERARAVPYFRAALYEADAALDGATAAPEPSRFRARAYSGLAESLLWAREADEAESAARTAVELDGGDARGHLVLGSVLLARHWAWDEAERHLRLAAESGSQGAGAEVALAFLLVSSRRAEEALAALDRAAALEPTAAVVTGDIGMLYGWLGRHERALELCRRTVAIEPRAAWGYDCALRAAAAMGDAAEVARSSAELVRLWGEDPRGVLGPFRGIEDRLVALRGYRVSRDGAGSFGSAIAWAEVGRVDRALDALEAAVANRELGAIALDAHPSLRGLAGEPRYERLRSVVLAGASG